MSGEPWVWEPTDPATDRECPACHEQTWDDRTGRCSCGETIEDVAERIAGQTNRPECLRPPWHPDCYWPKCKCGDEAFQRAQAIRDYQANGGPE